MMAYFGFNFIESENRYLDLQIKMKTIGLIEEKTIIRVVFSLFDFF